MNTIPDAWQGPYTVKVLRDDETVRAVMGLPDFRVADLLAKALPGDRIVAAQVWRDRAMLRQYLLRSIEPLVQELILLPAYLNTN